MFCKFCGKEVNENASLCLNCGCAIEENVHVQQKSSRKDGTNAGFALLSFFFPIIGLLLWLIWKEEYPRLAKSCGKGALVGACVSLVSTIVGVVAVAYIIGGMFNMMEPYAMISMIL